MPACLWGAALKLTSFLTFCARCSRCESGRQTGPLGINACLVAESRQSSAHSSWQGFHRAVISAPGLVPWHPPGLRARRSSLPLTHQHRCAALALESPCEIYTLSTPSKTSLLKLSTSVPLPTLGPRFTGKAYAELDIFDGAAGPPATGSSLSAHRAARPPAGWIIPG
eukprot:364319-Chlamydomonas_euryale.AAC.16